MKTPLLAVVVPCFNESEVLEKTAPRLTAVMEGLIAQGKIEEKSYLLFVDDGSLDETWRLIRSVAGGNPRVRGLKLSRNYGHQYALLAGLMKAAGDRVDCAISIDSDLQQDETAMGEFLEKYAAGYDLVYGVRKDRESDSFSKRAVAGMFYRLMRMMGVDILPHHADYRLTSRRALEALADYPEANLFLRGIFPHIGFRSAIVYHEVREREAGNSKYSLKKMVSFALNGITSFTIAPIRVVTSIGVLVFSFSLVMSAYVLFTYLTRQTVHGWASTVLPIYFIGGIQLLSLGLIGEYVGRIYTEVKRRPRYIVEEEC